MFWKKTIRLLNRRLDNQFAASKEMSDKLNAVIEVLKSDRADINQLINQFRQLKTKGKK